MFSFYGSRNAARGRFRSEQKRQRLVANLIEQLVPEREKTDSLIVLGSATFATCMKGTQATPIGRLIKELAKKRRIVLVSEHFTTQMCSGCNLSGMENGIAVCLGNHLQGSPSLPSHARALHKTSSLRMRPYVVSTKASHVNHPTCAMASFLRTCEPVRMRLRREAREVKQALFPPDPGDSRRRRRNFDPLIVAIHGLKQCIHCGRYWNRDVNAARNIGWVFVSMWLQGERSVHLQRSVFKNSRSREGVPSQQAGIF